MQLYIYSHEVCKEILKSGLTRYYRLVLSEEAGERKLYRSAEGMQEGRSLKRFKTRFWYCSRRGGTKVTERKNFPERGIDLSKTERTKEGTR